MRKVKLQRAMDVMESLRRMPKAHQETAIFYDRTKYATALRVLGSYMGRDKKADWLYKIMRHHERYIFN
jgi:hypothetical protein